MTHLKRHKVPKKWPISRKGTTYVVKSSNLEKGIPILIILRDVLKIAQNRKEVKKAIHSKNILLNNKIITDEKISVTLFDTITLIPSKKYYKLDLSEKGKFKIKEIKEKESNYKISKIINKKILKHKKTQLNLNDGRNFLSELECNVNDSLLINLKNRKIEKCLELKEDVPAFVFGGKHSGIKGIIKKIDSKNKIVELKTNKKNVKVLIKQLMVIEK